MQISRAHFHHEPTVGKQKDELVFAAICPRLSNLKVFFQLNYTTQLLLMLYGYAQCRRRRVYSTDKCVKENCVSVHVRTYDMYECRVIKCILADYIHAVGLETLVADTCLRVGSHVLGVWAPVDSHRLACGRRTSLGSATTTAGRSRTGAVCGLFLQVRICSSRGEYLSIFALLPSRAHAGKALRKCESCRSCPPPAEL